MTLSTISKVQQIEDEWRAEQIAFCLEQRKKKESNTENDPSIESRLDWLEFEVQRLKKKIECTVE